MTFASDAEQTEQELAEFRQSMGLELPHYYVEYLKRGNAGEGFIGDEYLILWRIGELKQFNQEYEVREYLTDILLFGSNGGGEAYGFRTKSFPWEVVRVPFVGMAPELCIRVAGSFSEFLSSLKPS